MIRNIKLIVFITLLFSGIFSCKKYLDVRPKSQIKEEALLDNEKGFADALTGIYTLMARRTLYGDNLTLSFLDVLAQRYKSDKQTSPYWDLVHYNYMSNTSKLNVKSTISSIWLSMYSCVANANNILEKIDDKKDVFTGNHYDYIKGETLALRAMIHFDLLRIFGPIMSDNPEALSIPYRKVLDRKAIERQSGTKILELVIQDLEDALVLLKDDPILTGTEDEFTEFTWEFRKYRMNYVAVKALLARAQLYNGNKTEAYKNAKEVIDSGVWGFVNSQDISTSGVCRDRTFRNEQLFAVLINNMKEYTDLYFNTVPTTYEDDVLNNDDAFINGVFENSSTDYRRQFLWESRSGKLLLTKFLQFDEDNGGCPWFKNVIPLITISEMYYIAAESAPELSESISLLNEVMGHRGLDPLQGSIDDTRLQNEILKEYQKEFYGEGQLFFYYKRKNFSQIPGTTISTSSDVYVLPVPEEELIF